MQVLLKSLQSLQNTINDENRRITYELIDDLQQMFRQLQLEANAEQSDKQKQDLAKIRERAIHVERQYIEKLYDTNQLDDDMYVGLLHAIEDRLNRQETNMLMRLWSMTRQVFRMWLVARKDTDNDKTQFYSYVRMRQDVRRQAFLEALQYLKAEREKAPRKKKALYVIVIYEYEKAYEKLRKVTTVDSAREEEIREELHIQVMETQRSEIHKMYEEGLISREQEKDLRRFVNYIESVSLYEYVD